MKNKVFAVLLFSVLGIGIALTIAHLIYALCAYQNSSIIYFIGKELW